MKQQSREFDLIIFGATGFTGQLVFEYLIKNSENVKIGIAGRNEELLKSVKSKISPSTKYLIASTDNLDSLHAMCAKTKILVNCVGPYAIHGEPVIQACIKEGTHYLDITGEPSFIQKMIDKYDNDAKKSKICIIHGCGFDSIPADLGCLFLLQQFPQNEDFWKNIENVIIDGYLQVSGSPSSGTWNTLLHSLSNHYRLFGRKKEKIFKSKVDVKKIVHHKIGFHYNYEIKGYALPLKTSDPLIVKRSAALNHYYKVLIQFDFGMKILSKFGPEERSGPNKESRKNYYFKFTFCATATKKNDDTIKMEAMVSGGDPGYEETSKMMGESALCLLQDILPKKEYKTGVLTPATCFGNELIKRLTNKGIKFEKLF